MKPLFTVFTIGFMVLGVTRCGNARGPAEKETLIFETRELSREEIRARGLDLEIPDAFENTEEPGNTDGQLFPHQAFGESGSLILNTVKDLAHLVINSKDSHIAATLLGHAIPDRTSPADITGGKEVSKTYEKRVKSLLGGSILKLVYKISYQTNGKYKGKGAYLTNVKFTPLEVDVDPLWALSATATAESPQNGGTEKSPIAKFSFSVSFTVSGVGSNTATDEFTLFGNKDLMETKIRNFQK